MLHTKRHKLHALRGFTMTEIIVVVGIMMLLLSVGVGYTQKGGKQIVLFREHAQLTQQILRARSFATQKLRPGQETVCGYGIKIINNEEYVLFKDVGSGVCPSNGVMSDSEEIERFKLDPGVRIIEPNHSEFIFSPRDGFVYFGSQPALPSQDPIQIPLVLTSTGQQLIIGVNYIGQVYTE